VPATKNASFKNYSKNVLRNKTQLYGIILVDLIQNVIINKHHYMQLDIQFLKIVKNWNLVCLTHSLTVDHGCKPRGQTKQCTATILCPQFYDTIVNSLMGCAHMEKFAEICLVFTQAAPICSLQSWVFSIVFYSLAHISFHLNCGYQIHKYHEKKQLLENKMIPNEAQCTKNPLVIKNHSHLSVMHFLWSKLTIITNSFKSHDMFGFTTSLFMSDSNKP